MTWPLGDPPNSAVYTTKRVASGGAAVVLVVRDDEGDWQAVDAGSDPETDAALLALAELLRMQPDLEPVLERLDKLGWGWQAERGAGAEWTYSPFRLDDVE